MILTPHPAWEVIDSTKLNDFISCPRKYFYKHIVGWDTEHKSNHLIYGIAIHKALEVFAEKGFSPETTNEAFETFLNSYRKELSYETDEFYEPKTPNNTLVMLAEYAKKYQRDWERYEVLYSEISGNVSLHEDVTLFFRMDTIIQELETGKIFSLEHKTTSSDYLWEHQWPLAIQIGMYNHVLRCMHDPETVGGVLINGLIMRKNKTGWAQALEGKPITTKTQPFEFRRFPVCHSNNHMAVWSWNTTYLVDLIRHHMTLLNGCTEEDQILACFDLRPSSCLSYGHVCEFHDFCLAWANPLRKAFSPPAGFIQRFWDPREIEAKNNFELKGEM